MSDFSLLGYKRENSIDQLLDDPVLLDINVLISDSNIHTATYINTYTHTY